MELVLTMMGLICDDSTIPLIVHEMLEKGNAYNYENRNHIQYVAECTIQKFGNRTTNQLIEALKNVDIEQKKRIINVLGNLKDL